MVRLLLTCLAMGVAGAATVGNLLEKTTEFQLPNGLRVVVLERASSAALSISLIAKGGWADDPPGKRGLARVMERMVQEGGFAIGSKNAAEERKAQATADALADKWEAEANKVQPDELLASRLKVDAEEAFGRLDQMYQSSAFRRQLEDAGGALTGTRVDATTTAIAATIPAAQAEVWFNGMASWLQDPSWRNFYEHRQEVGNGARTSDEQTAVLNGLAAKAFAKHAWGQPEIDMQELFKVRLKDLAAQHRQVFAPGNIVVSVVGNLPAAEVRALAEKHFGMLAAQPPMAHNWTGRDEKPWSMPAGRQGLAVLAMGYRRSALDSPDDPVLDVLAHMLTAGPDSYLATKLVQRRKAATITGAISYPSPAGGGLLVIMGTPPPGMTLPDFEKMLQDAINEFAAEPQPAVSLLPAKRRFIASAVRLLEDDPSAADTLGRYVSSLGSTKALATVLQQLDAVTPADVQRAAKQYLKPEDKVSITWVGAR